MKRVLGLLTIFVLLGHVSAAKAQTFQHFKKVVWLVFENENYDNAMKQPDFARVAKLGAYFSNYTAETHPSQGNYITMIAGSSFGVVSDKNVDLNATHVGDLLEKANLDWRVYAENFPGNCYTGAQSGNYVRKHVPFLSFTNVSRDQARCAKIKTNATFNDDLANGKLAEFNMYIPNIKNDGHDTGLDVAGKWLTAQFGNIFSNPALTKDVLFIVTFDEDDHNENNHIYTALIGGQVKQGAQIDSPVGHPALLKMIEDEYGIGTLGREDSKAPPIQGLWN
ncbi:MAG: alkaline phosphatase family protein [Pseudobdellovibrio sp.]